MLSNMRFSCIVGKIFNDEICVLKENFIKLKIKSFFDKISFIDRKE
jgi:hypothetical protein